MREIDLNGYIDDALWYGDEITPEALHETLYGVENQYSDDVHIRLNSYGGSCNAAVRMHDDIRAYPGSVHLTVSGTAASAATVLAMAADWLEMTPGSLWMIHDPSVVAWGDERDLLDAINLLKACKESILNVYARRCRTDRVDVAAMMTACTWLDAQSALARGFIDAIAEPVKTGALQNAAPLQTVTREEAERRVRAWLDRHKPFGNKPSRPDTTDDSVSGDDHTSAVPPVNEQVAMPEEQGGTAQAPQSEVSDTGGEREHTDTVAQEEFLVVKQSDATDSSPPDAPSEQPETTGTPVAQLRKRLGLLMPADQRSTTWEES